MSTVETQEISREELAAGKLRTGEMDGKRFAEFIDVAYGTVKRWLHEGMPATRRCKKVWIDPTAAKAWIDNRFAGKKTIAFDRTGYVYFAKSESGLIKIGWGSDIMRRVQELRKARREAVHLVACFPGEKPDELRLHEQFASLRTDGEWFQDDGSIEAFIGSILSRAA